MDDYLIKLQQKLNEQNVSKDYYNAVWEYAVTLRDSGLPVIFDNNHLSKLLGLNPSVIYYYSMIGTDYSYKILSIPKKRGGFRTLNVPTSNLKHIQRWILDNIISKMYYSDSSTGFMKGNSIVKNAAKHLEKRCVLNMDLKDFFPSIKEKDVYRIFRYYGYTRQVSFILARLCIHNNQLPQGAPTSPALSNIRCIKLDKRISNLCKSINATYTRYADDITISSDCDLKNLITIVKEIVEEEGLKINEKKTRITYSHQRQEVTGLIVNNEKVSVPRKYKRDLKQEIYYCKKYGPYNHQKHIGDKHSFYKEHLYGKVLFVKMVEPELGQILLEELDCIKWDY